MPEYVEAFTPWVIHSSTHGLFGILLGICRVAEPVVPPWMYHDKLDLELERA